MVLYFDDCRVGSLSYPFACNHVLHLLSCNPKFKPHKEYQDQD
jgi:hypothetical protein